MAAEIKLELVDPDDFKNNIFLKPIKVKFTSKKLKCGEIITGNIIIK